MREQEFGSVRLQKGSTPAWELSYADFAPYYDRAERLYRVHGKAGVDPTEPPRQGDYGLAPRPIEPVMDELRAAFERQGIRAYDLPLSWSESQSHPCGDAELFGVDRALGQDGFELRQGARVLMLHTDAGGKEVRHPISSKEGPGCTAPKMAHSPCSQETSPSTHQYPPSTH